MHRSIIFFVCAGVMFLLPLLPLLTSGICIPFFSDCRDQRSSILQSRSTSWLTMMSCTANQVPKLTGDFDKPLYQYIFEVFARNTHLLPLGVPMQSQSEDFESTAAYEKCLWGVRDIERNSIDEEEDNIINPETKTEETAYHQLFASRQGGYDSLTGFSLLGGKIVAALIGYIVYTLTG